MNQRIENAAQQLLDEHELSELPVPVEMIAERSGAAVRYRTFDGDVSGLLLRTEDGIIIGVNSTHPKTRQRFTIAHELGHLNLKSHKGRPVTVEHLTRGARVNWRDGTASQATDKEEIEANQFAAALLMPKELVEQEFWELAQRQPDEVIIQRLSRRFQVSGQAMRFRLVNLALLDPM